MITYFFLHKKMSIFDLFFKHEETEEKLWKILNDIINNSSVFLSFYDSDDHDNNNTIDIAFNLPIDFNLLYKVSNKELIFNKDETVKIVKNLHYLDSMYLKEMLVYLKENYPEEGFIYEHLEEMYNEIIIVKDKNNYLINDCLNKFVLSFNNYKDNYLECSSRYGSINCFKYLTQNDSCKHKFDEYIDTAIIYDNLNIIEHIYELDKYSLLSKIHIENILKYDNLDILKFYIKTFILKLDNLLLCFACENKSANIVKYFVETNVDLNPCYMENPLEFAIDSGSIELVKYLIEKGANINAPAYVILNGVIKNGSLEMYIFLVENLLKLDPYININLIKKTCKKHKRFDIINYLN